MLVAFWNKSHDGHDGLKLGVECTLVSCTMPRQGLQVYHKLHSSGSLPTFVAPANIRGTFDMLRSGLFTIFICIWTVQHLNVPEPRDGRDPGWKGDMKWGWKKIARKFKWMAFTLLLPEILLGKATVEFLAVRESLKRIRLSSGYQAELTSAEKSNWTKSHGFYAEMGDFVLLPRGNEASLVWHVAIEDILKLRECGILSTLPTISADHINNMSTGDFFAKATAVVQVTWMVIQVIVRFVKGLPVTQLEVTACSFAVTTCLIYLLWWEKPQGVNRVTELPSSLDYNIGSRYSGRISVFELDFLLDPSSRLRKWFAKEGMANDSIAYGYDWEFGIGITLGGEHWVLSNALPGTLTFRQLLNYTSGAIQVS